MDSKVKTVLFLVLVIVVGVGAWAWFEWPEIRGDQDEDERPEATTAAVVPEAPAPQQPAGKQIIYNFDSDEPGRLPLKFHAALTGRGAQGNWVVQSDPAAPSRPNVLAQIAKDQTDYRFPLAISDEGSYGDLNLSAKFKPVSGSIDQAGGLVFRLRDANNYYLARANALENNFNFYKVVNGRRSEIKGSRVMVSSGHWHELRVEAIGNKITCYFDGQKQLEATDGTFREAGKIGLWTKADSVSYFDDVQVLAK